MGVSTDLSQGAKPARFAAILKEANEGRVALKEGLRAPADEEGCAVGRHNFYRGLAERCDPLPLGEIHSALQHATTAFEGDNLATWPYKYKSVIPITTPPPALPPAVTEWPEGVTVTCSLDIIMPDSHCVLEDWMCRNKPTTRGTHQTAQRRDRRHSTWASTASGQSFGTGASGVASSISAPRPPPSWPTRFFYESSVPTILVSGCVVSHEFWFSVLTSQNICPLF